MTYAPAMEQRVQRVDRLLRSLVGVADLRASWDGPGRLAQLDVLKDPQVSDNQISRNILSALKAAFGIRLEMTSLRIFREASLFAAEATAASETQAAPEEAGPGAATSDVAPAPANGNGAAPRPEHGANGNGAERVPLNGSASAAANGASSRSNGNGHGAFRPTAGLEPNGHAENELERPPVAATQPNGNGTVGHALTLERVEIERLGGNLRCHVVLALGARRYSAIAEVADGPTAEAEVAARVTLDALRAGSLTNARLDGVGFACIADTTYVVAAVRDAGTSSQRACAAPLAGGLARSAAAAVLRVIGPLNDTTRNPAGR
jgi:hypothetical protein